MAEAKRLASFIADLESNDFALRERASAELMKLGESAEPALQRSVAAPLASLETKNRAEAILVRLDRSPQRLPAGRLLQVLEQIGNAEARGLLAELASGALDAWLTREAREALNRLPGRAGRLP